MIARVAHAERQPLETVRREAARNFARVLWRFVFLRCEEERARAVRRSEQLRAAYLTALAFNDPAGIATEAQLFEAELNPMTARERDRLIADAKSLEEGR